MDTGSKSLLFVAGGIVVSLMILLGLMMRGYTPGSVSVDLGPVSVDMHPPGERRQSAASELLLRPSCSKVYVVKANRPVRILYGLWGAKGIELIQENVAHLDVSIRIDGRLANGSLQSEFLPMSQIPCGDVLEGAHWAVHTTQLDSFSVGEHTIEVVYTFDESITDGYDQDSDGALDVFDPSSPVRQVYTVIAE